MRTTSTLRPRGRWAGAIGLACLAAAVPAGQGPAPQPPGEQAAPADQPPRPTFRLDANFVRVDLYPTSGGRPVTDLSLDEVEIREDGVPQAIETFEHVQLQTGVPVEQRRDPGSVSRMRAEAENPRARLFVIFLDTKHTDLAGSHRMQRTLVNMLDRMLSPDDLFAVMTPQMSPTDLAFARKSETTEGYLRRHWTWGERDRLMPTDPAEQMLTMCYPPDIAPGRGGRLLSELAEDLIARRREKVVLDALTDLTLYLRGLREERKAVIAITNGWLLPGEQPGLLAAGRPPNPTRIGTTPTGRLTVDRERDQFGTSEQQCERERQLLAFTNFRQEFFDLMETANRANVSFYPVDSRGLAASDSPVFVLSDKSPAQEIKLVQARVESLRTLADNTDGLAVVDTNALDQGVARIVADMTSYYLAGYYSSNTKLDGRYRKISVRVKRPGVEVRARRGYKALEASDLLPATASASATPAGPPAGVTAALATLVPGRPAALRTRAAFTRRGAAGPGPLRLWAVVELDAQAARRDFPGGADVSVMAASADGPVVAQSSAAIAPGSRVALVDLGEVVGVGGDLAVRARVKPRGEGAAVSEFATVSTDGPASAVLWRRGPATGMKDVPTADARFSRADRVRVEVAMPGGAGPVSAMLLDRAGGTLAVPVAAATRADGATTWATAELALAPLGPGEYVVKLSMPGPDGPADVYTGVRVVP